MSNEIEFVLPNGYIVWFINEDGRIVVGLDNPDGYTISDRNLTECSLKELKNVIYP